MPFTLSRISDVGTAHPVVARLPLQTHDLLRYTRFTSATRDRLTEASYAASMRLVNCWNIQANIAAECDNAERALAPSPRQHLLHLPHVNKLQHHSEAFLYEAKNFLREVISIINIAFGTTFSEPSEFYLGKVHSSKKQSIEAWGQQNMHPDDPFNDRLRLHKEWTMEMVYKRNAVEHPGDRSGSIHIENYDLMSDGSVRRPVWYRNQDLPRNITDDMRFLGDNMLVLAEELIVFIAQRAMAGTGFCVRELPEQQRDPRSPVRFVVRLTDEEDKVFNEAQKESG